MTNTAVAWSSGVASTGYHFIETGPEAIVVRTLSGEVAVSFLGNVGGTATDANTMFYKKVSMRSLTVGGDIKMTKSTSALLSHNKFTV